MAELLSGNFSFSWREEDEMDPVDVFVIIDAELIAIEVDCLDRLDAGPGSGACECCLVSEDLFPTLAVLESSLRLSLGSFDDDCF
jgi:hypothetical protein